MLNSIRFRPGEILIAQTSAIQYNANQGRVITHNGVLYITNRNLYYFPPVLPSWLGPEYYRHIEGGLSSY